MTLSILIPVKAFTLGKSRLSTVLGQKRRETLCRDFLRHSLSVATDPRLKAQVHVISASAQVLAMATDHGAHAWKEGAAGHNPALTHAMARLPTDRPVLIVNADLPFLEVDDLLAMDMAGRSADIVIATDHKKQGTNALWLARPDLITMRFGPDSRAAHIAQAGARGLVAETLIRPGLARDIDLPEDLEFLPCHA